MSGKIKSAKPDSFEDSMQRLQEIVERLQSGELPLKESLAIYKEGLECSRRCRRFLEEAKKDIELWREENMDGDETGDN